MRTVILGIAGTGKSYVAGEVIEDCVPDFEAAIHYDIQDEEIGLSIEDGLFTSLYVDREMYENGIPLLDAVKKYKYIRVVPEGLDEEEQIEIAGQIADFATHFGHQTGPDTGIFISMDEAHEIAPEGQLDGRISRMVTGGRSLGVEFLFVTQRPALLDTTIITQTDYLMIFKMKDRDMKKIQNSVSYDASILKDLNKREMMVEHLSSGEFKKVDTDGIERKHPHLAADDGKANHAVDKFLDDD